MLYPIIKYYDMKKFFLFSSTLLLASIAGLCQTNQILVSSDINFGDVALGSTKTDYVIVRNVSGFALTYQIANLSNFIPPAQSSPECGSVGASTFFSTTGSFSGTLQPGQRDTLRLTFAPKDYQSNNFQGFNNICNPKCIQIPNCQSVNTSGLGSYTANMSITQTNGSTFTKTISIVGKSVAVTSSDDASVSNNTLTLHPNPAQDLVNVGSLDAKLVLYNALGDRVLSTTIIKGQFSVVGLTSGIYTAEICTLDGKKYFQKLLKE